MAGGPDTPGQERVGRLERNNRNSSMAKAESVKTPRKRGAQAGFDSNATKGGGINRPLAGVPGGLYK